MEDLLSFGVQKLWDLLSQEYEQFQGVKDQVVELKTSLYTLKSFLEDAAAKKHTSAMVRNCVEVIKEIVCDAEDIIETFVIKDNLGKEGGIKKRIRRLAFIIPERREIALEIEGISKRISKVISEMKSFGVQHMIIDGGYSAHNSLHDRQREMRHTFSRDHESDLVGLDESIKKLVGLMVEEEDVQVFSITGMGGIGKTTLARQVYNHEMVKNHFDGLAWVCVSQDFTRKSVWQGILRNLRPKEEEKQIMEMAEPTLHDELFRLLETSKSLIVLDDIWKEKDWDLIKNIFPPKKGWKVLLTSRKKSIAVRDDTSINFESQCLGNKDSWTLLQRISFPRGDASELKKVDKEMEKMAKKMIKHCGGLPLAVRVLGGLLAAKYTLHDWKRINEDIGSHLVGRTNLSDDNNHSINYVLFMSFEELPSYLKHCFLYLAHFPEDHEIYLGQLSYYWAAEGVFKPKYYDGETIQDVGSSYIEELARRNMVICKRGRLSSKFETCHLHDMMREICLFKAKEENFLQLGGIGCSNANSQSRRFAWQYPTTLNVEREVNNPKLRSLVILPYDRRKRWMLSGLSFKRLQLLRVLDLSHAEFEGGKLPHSIGKLIHLRYLSLESVKVSHLPSSLKNLNLLLYLNINVSGAAIFVPNILMGMKELRYLALPMRLHKKTKLELSSLVSLETLLQFSPEKCSLEDLKGMSRLRCLSICLTDESNVDTLFSSISGLKYLESLFILGRKDNKVVEEKIVLDSVHLKMLVMRISMPKLRHFPSHLTCLDLDECDLEEDPMPILEKLLHLVELRLMCESFSGKRMTCSGGGFPQLRQLYISALLELEEWIIGEGSMPLLQVLAIRKCIRLEQLHDGLRFIYSLKDLSICSMGDEWKARLSEGGEDHYKVQHIPSVKFFV